MTCELLYDIQRLKKGTLKNDTEYLVNEVAELINNSKSQKWIKIKEHYSYNLKLLSYKTLLSLREDLKGLTTLNMHKTSKLLLTI